MIYRFMPKLWIFFLVANNKLSELGQNFFFYTRNLYVRMFKNYIFTTNSPIIKYLIDCFEIWMSELQSHIEDSYSLPSKYEVQEKSLYCQYSFYICELQNETYQFIKNGDKFLGFYPFGNLFESFHIKFRFRLQRQLLTTTNIWTGIWK